MLLTKKLLFLNRSSVSFLKISERKIFFSSFIPPFFLCFLVEGPKKNTKIQLNTSKLFSVIAFLDLGIYYELTVLLGLVKGEAIKPASVSYHIYHEKKRRGDIPCLLRKSLPATGNNHGVW